MINKKIWTALGGAIIAYATSSLYAGLNQQQFIEAVGVLGIDPDSTAAAGISEQELMSIWDALTEDDAGFATYLNARDQLRASVDALAGTDNADQSHAEIEQAKEAIVQLVSGWRLAVCSEVDANELGRLNLIASQAGLGVPVFVRVLDWTEAEQADLRRGYAQMLRNQRMGQDAQTVALQFYDSAQNRSEVLVAKANWEVRQQLYNLLFVEHINTLN